MPTAIGQPLPNACVPVAAWSNQPGSGRHFSRRSRLVLAGLQPSAPRPHRSVSIPTFRPVERQSWAGTSEPASTATITRFRITPAATVIVPSARLGPAPTGSNNERPNSCRFRPTSTWSSRCRRRWQPCALAEPSDFLYGMLFEAASQTLMEVAANPRHLGADQIGLLAVLHTWGQNLMHHPHLHCVVNVRRALAGWGPLDRLAEVCTSCPCESSAASFATSFGPCYSGPSSEEN